MSFLHKLKDKQLARVNMHTHGCVLTHANYSDDTCTYTVTERQFLKDIWTDTKVQYRIYSYDTSCTQEVECALASFIYFLVQGLSYREGEEGVMWAEEPGREVEGKGTLGNK